MAIQYQFAYPEDISAVGSLAGGVWNCSQGDWQRARKACMSHPEEVQIEESLKTAEEMQKKNELGNLSLIRKHKVFLFQGLADSVLKPEQADHLENFLSKYSPLLTKKADLQAGHGFPTLKTNIPCEQNKIPWLINCQYDLSAEMLSWFFGPLKSSVPAQTNSLLTFDQKEFSQVATKVAGIGHAYIPKACLDESCPALIMLHGCLMSPTILGEQFINGTELNDWAEGNNLIIVYPATTRSVGNPNGCWDWFSYTGKDFLSRKAPQIVFLNQIIQRLKDR